METVFSVRPPRGCITRRTEMAVEGYDIHVEVGSNTSTVTLRVVGGDEKGSLKSETVNVVARTKGLGPEKDCASKGQQHVQKTDPSSRQRGRPTKNKTVTVKQ
jgi:hypothetical protein